MLKTRSKRQLIGINEAGHVVSFEEKLEPVGPGQVLVRIHASMISSGTQLQYIRQQRREAKPASNATPMALGYQAAGEIVEIGDNVKSLAVGQRVACFGIGAQHSDYGVIAQNLCFPIPDEISYEAASGMNLVATAMQAVRRAQPELGEFMLVVGLGIVGQFTAQLSRAAGMYVMGWDTLPGRRSTAMQLGVDATANPLTDDVQDACKAFTAGHGFDAAVMAIGGDGTKALESVRDVMKVSPDSHAMGRIVMVGGLKTVASWGANLGNLDLRCSARTGPGYHDHRWEHGETEYPPVFMRWTTPSNIQLAFRMMRDGRFDVESLISHRFPLSRAAEAIDLIVESDEPPLGVVLTSDPD